MRTILFICSGNTCRSPMAEAIARDWLEREGLSGEVFVASAGVSATTGSPAAWEAVDALGRLGIDHEGRSKPLTRQMIAAASAVMCMTDAHLQAVRELIKGSDAQTPVLLLNPKGDIDDPIGMGQARYDAVAKQMRTLVPARLREVLKDADRARL